MSSASAKPKMDVTEEQAKVLISKRLLVGIAHCSANGEVTSREQFYGTVVRANLQEGVVLNLMGTGNERAVNLELAQLQKARPGKYTLTGMNEVVEDPDYTLRLTLCP